MTGPSPAVRCRGLTKRFGTRTAFEDLSFEVRRGEVFGFLGPNGAGKTTTVRVLGTLLAPTSGRAEVVGLPLSAEAGPEIRRRVAVMTETPGLYLKLSLAENLELFAGLYGMGGRRTAARIADALEAVGLADRRDDLAGSLSKGLRQRAALARALLAEPEVLFLDEPTTGLDPAAAREVRELIAGLRAREVTVFLTTHRLEEAERLCHRVAILNTRLLALGTPEELRRQRFSPTLRVRLARALEDPDRVLGGVPGVVGWTHDDGVYRLRLADPRGTTPEVVRALVGTGADVLEVGEERPSLEETYLRIVGEDPGDEEAG